ncbi:inorganic diphosphatase [Hyalangium minutum]|uniref:inorganic diphosphatase n=1 Tax=Hyalangium minutum TaxID=394096 RepID=A0A085WJ12_9BACT|nr:inorganic diphosphatase [Hyalangium minutum]KFE67675.1 Inorganic pyrophosphatase [Hyalangium minutum]
MAPASEFTPFPGLPSEPEVLIETPRFSWVKWRADGRVDFISPVPCPYNYGCIPGHQADDGDPLDVVVLGPRLSRGTRVKVPVVGVVDFIDAGRGDPKVICSASPMSAGERAGVERFFSVYALFKRGLHRVRGQVPDTRFRGWLAGPFGEPRTR